MRPGSIVVINWRDALAGSGEPNKRRPGVIVGSPHFFGSGLPFEIVVPLTSEPSLAISGASVSIQPTPENGCTSLCFALAWNVQSVPHARLTVTRSRVSDEELAEIRNRISACIAEGDEPPDAAP